MAAAQVLSAMWSSTQVQHNLQCGQHWWHPCQGCWSAVMPASPQHSHSQARLWHVDKVYNKARIRDKSLAQKCNIYDPHGYDRQHLHIIFAKMLKMDVNNCLSNQCYIIQKGVFLLHNMQPIVLICSVPKYGKIIKTVVIVQATKTNQDSMHHH